jgi:ribosomal protein S18 acetylase RimI-like enzyme
MIRTAVLNDRDSLFELQLASGLFSADDIDGVAAIMDACLAGKNGPDHHWIVFEADDSFLGAAYFAPEAVSDRVWNLLMIAVMPEAQGKGIGEQLVVHIEGQLKDMGQRILIVETSSADQFDKSRAFYERLGFAEEGRIRHYYGDDAHKVIFAKALS